MITGNDFKKARTEKSLTQEKFAEEMGISARTICRYESGQCLKECNKYYRLFQHLGWAGQRETIEENGDKNDV